MTIQKLLKQLAYALGFIIIKLRNTKITGIDLNHDLKQLINNSQPIILDIGANSGQSIENFRKLWSSSIIHSFEPTSRLAELLKKRFQDDRTFINPTAMGSTASKATLLVNQKSVLNSFLPLDQTNENRFREKKIIDSEEVTIDTVDSYIRRHNLNNIQLLKTDTQGFDMEVLKGASESISNGKIKQVLIEINFINMYQNQAKSTDILNFLFDNNYALVGIYEISRSHQSRIDWCTALFTLKSTQV